MDEEHRSPSKGDDCEEFNRPEEFFSSSTIFLCKLLIPFPFQNNVIKTWFE